MPIHYAGGSPAAWPHVRPIFQAVAAKVPEGDPNGAPCCDWVGETARATLSDGAQRHRYGDMQISRGLSAHEGRARAEQRRDERCFRRWNTGVLESYLIEITRDILAYHDEQGQAVGRDPGQRRAKGYRQVTLLALDQGTRSPWWVRRCSPLPVGAGR